MIDATQLRARIAAPRSDYHLGACWSCDARLTSADLEAGRCTNCEMEIDDDGDSSDCRERGIRWLTK